MKNLALAALLTLSANYALGATLTVQNSSDDPIRVWLYTDKKDLINTWVVDTDKPKTLNSGLHEISTIVWLAEKHVPHEITNTTAHLGRTSAGGSPFSMHLSISPMAIGHRFYVLKNGSYKYQPGRTKKKDTISGRARRLSETEE